MPDGMQEDTVDNNQRFTQRWKVMLALSTILIALGICVDWCNCSVMILSDRL